MQQTKRLLVIGAGTPYGSGILWGIHGYCQTHGKWDYCLQDDESPETVRRAATIIQRWKPDGIISQIHKMRVVRLMRNCGLPVVSVSTHAFGFPAVRTQHVMVGKMAARHFLDNGFRSFGFCAMTPEIPARDRCDGFRKELALAGFECSVFTDQYAGVVNTNWTRNNERTAHWLLSLNKPAAVLCNYIARAHEIAMMCRHLKLRVPDDVALVAVGAVGANNELLYQMCTPPVSTIDVDSRRIGYEAARLLHRLLKGGKPPKTPILIPPVRLKARQSSDIMAVDDPDIAAAMRLIRAHTGNPLTVKELLCEVPLGRKAMERRFEKLIGRTPKEEILRVRLERARTLLEETDLPISVIAERSGCMGRGTFVRFFQRGTGTTPSEYRKAHQRKQF